jgi:general secretion pathway protein G
MRVVRALKVIISPALRPLLQILAAFGLVISFSIILTGFFAASPRDPNRARYIYCTLQVQRLSAALKQYRADCGDYPSSKGGLQSLVTNQGNKSWRGPYIKEVPLDPWGRPFLYLRSSNSPQPEIFSYGADGKPGGEFLNVDISSRNLERPIPATPFEVRTRWLMAIIWIGAWGCFVGCIAILRKTSRRYENRRPRE